MISGNSDMVHIEAYTALELSEADGFVRFLDLCHSTFVAVAIWDSIIASYGDLYRMDIIPW